jgi:hypothetical protein
MADRRETNLKRWSSRPLWKLNGVAIASTTALMLWLFTVRQRVAEPEMHLRYAALLFMSIHGMLHYLSRRGLHLMVQKHQTGAEEALRAYLDVRRVSHLDLAVAWIGFFAVAPHLV